MSDILTRLRSRAHRLTVDLPFFAEHCLKIRPKAGGLVPLKFNRAQLRLHEALEAQKHETGKVRQLLVKGRQMGSSTYCAARIFHRITKEPGLAAFVLCHNQQGVEHIYGITQRFHQNLPQPIAPQTITANQRELHFGGLDSSISVATAGSKNVGRASTLQMLHASEVAHWEHADAHAGGLLQALADVPGSEAIFESTANGPVGLFHDLTQAALRNETDFRVTFLPWYWDPQYRLQPPDDWAPTEEVFEVGELYDLDDGQLFWLERKNAELAAASGQDPDRICWTFRQEYPSHLQEAFQAGDFESFIRPEVVARARKWTAPDQVAARSPLVFGVDVGRGRDLSTIIDRRGRVAGALVDEKINTPDLMDVCGRLGKLIDQHHPDKVFVDVVGIGSGVVDRMREMNFREVVGINFGERAMDKDKFANRRAECWARMAEWLADPGGADVPDSDEWMASLTMVGFSFDSNSRLLMERKDDIRKRCGGSPDTADSLSLTFAETVRSKSASMRHQPAEAEIDYPIHEW